MSGAGPSGDEGERLEALRRVGLLSAGPDEALDDFAHVAAALCQAPMALIALVDEEREWFKARLGVQSESAPRGRGPSEAVADGGGWLEVPDTERGGAFAWRAALGQEGARALFGALLTTPDGDALGALCVLDRQPRALTDAQRGGLQALGRQVARHIGLRLRSADLDRSTLELERTQLASRTASRAVQSLLNLQRAIFEGASHAIIACGPDGAVLSFNGAAARMLGYEPDEVVGREAFARFLDGTELAARALALQRELGEQVAPDFAALTAKARRGVPDENEWTFVRKDGSRVPVLLTLTALRDAHGGLTGFVGLAQDITERKQVDQLKGEFVSIVSHELRTPLTSIRGALGLLEGGVMGPLRGEVMEMLAIARANSDRLMRLIDDILDLEKIEAGAIELRPQRIEAAQLSRVALEGIRSLAEAAGVQMNALVSDGTAFHGDQDRLLQVLTNLLSNAIKFSPPGGTVWLRAETAGANLRFSVTDHGPGVPEHQRQIVFRKFHQLDASDSRQKGGTGLGLAISKAIVEQHRGRIWVESTGEPGACFVFEVPRLPSTPG